MILCSRDILELRSHAEGFTDDRPADCPKSRTVRGRRAQVDREPREGYLRHREPRPEGFNQKRRTNTALSYCSLA